MGDVIKAFVSGACNSFRSDGYRMAVGSYKPLGETTRRIQTKRAVALSKNMRTTSARTKELRK